MDALEDTESLLESSRAKVKSIWQDLKSGQSRLKTVGDVNQELQKYLDWLQESNPEVYVLLIRGKNPSGRFQNNGLRELRLEIIGDEELKKYQNQD